MDQEFREWEKRPYGLDPESIVHDGFLALEFKVEDSSMERLADGELELVALLGDVRDFRMDELDRVFSAATSLAHKLLSTEAGRETGPLRCFLMALDTAMVWETG